VALGAPGNTRRLGASGLCSGERSASRLQRDGVPGGIPAGTPMSAAALPAEAPSAAYAPRRCQAFGRVNVWMPYFDSVRPMPE
jgi:hypothetical protein